MSTPAAKSKSVKNVKPVAVIEQKPEAPPPVPSVEHLVEPMSDVSLEESEEETEYYSSTNKPQVWVKLRPVSNYQDNFIGISPDGLTLEVVKSDTVDGAKLVKTYPTDGILQNSGHEEVYRELAQRVVERAMLGTSGVILCVGPESSGKSFTLFGDVNKYESRGVIPRSLDRIFEIARHQSSEICFRISMSMVEVRKDKLMDLLTLCPYPAKNVSLTGNNGVFWEELSCAEHGIGLLLRGLYTQRHLPKESFAKSHTILYISIEGQRTDLIKSNGALKFSSKITFAKMAPIPKRTKILVESIYDNKSTGSVIQSENCFFMTPPPPPKKPVLNTVEISNLPKGVISEAISVRRDFLFLEQMFLRVTELQKLNQYYNKLRLVGMEGIMKRPSLAPARYFRQSKLCDCLRDIVKESSEVRIVLHMRPESTFLPSALEALRFAERAQCMPQATKTDLGRNGGDVKDWKLEDLSSLREEIKMLREELGRVSKFGDANVRLSKSHVENLQEVAREYIDGKTDEISIESKAEALTLFEKFRALWKESGKVLKPTVGLADIAKESLSRHKKLKSPESATETPVTTPADTSSDHSLINTAANKNAAAIKARKSKSKKKVKETNKSPPETTESNTELSTVSTDGKKIEKPESPENLNSLTSKKKKGVSIETKDGAEGSLPQSPTNAHLADGPQREEAWAEFIKQEKGHKLAEHVSAIDKTIADSKKEHGDSLKMVSQVITRITNRQVEFDSLQQNRHISGDEYDQAGNIIVPKREKDLLLEIRQLKQSRDQMLNHLKEVKTQMHQHIHELDEAKIECETQFQLFCLENYSLIYKDKEGGSKKEDGSSDLVRSSRLDLNSGVPESREGNCQLPMGFPCSEKSEINEEEQAATYLHIKQMAEEQGRILLHHFTHKPVWKKYFKNPGLNKSNLK